jgi:WD40 repeat protein
VIPSDRQTHRCWTPLRALRAPLVGAFLSVIIGGCTLFSTPPSPSPSPSATPTPTPTPVESPTPRIGSFTTAAAMSTSRIGATATMLPDGDVLIAGGRSEGLILASAEMFDPRSGTFAATGSMTQPRAGHTATVLPNGNILIVGGSTDNSAEIYSPATGKFSKTGSTIDNFAGRIAVSLGDGRVLVAGGSGGGLTASYAELYSSTAGRFTRAKFLVEARANAWAVPLLDGRILIMGGDQGVSGRYANILSSAEFYSPSTGRFTAAPTMKSARTHFAAVRLQDGRVFVAGGLSLTDPFGILDKSEIYDPRTATWTETGSMMVGRSDFTATLLDDGRVLVLGGGDRSAELFDPATGTFRAAANMSIARERQTATLLKDTRVLVAGGSDFSLAEYYNP